jgi:hypothetical protein
MASMTADTWADEMVGLWVVAMVVKLVVGNNVERVGY